MKKNQLDRKYYVDLLVFCGAITVVAVFAAGFIPEAEESVAATARGVGRISPLIPGSGSFWGDILVMAVGAWICLRWASGIDDTKTIKSKRKKPWWRRILFP